MSLFLINLCYGVYLQMLYIKIEKKNYIAIAKSVPNNDFSFELFEDMLIANLFVLWYMNIIIISKNIINFVFVFLVKVQVIF